MMLLRKCYHWIFNLTIYVNSYLRIESPLSLNYLDLVSLFFLFLFSLRLLLITCWWLGGILLLLIANWLLELLKETEKAIGGLQLLKTHNELVNLKKKQLNFEVDLRVCLFHSSFTTFYSLFFFFNFRLDWFLTLP